MLLKRESLQCKIDHLRKKADYLEKKNLKLQRENEFLLLALSSLKENQEEFKKAWNLWHRNAEIRGFWEGFKSSAMDTAVRRLLQ